VEFATKINEMQLDFVTLNWEILQILACMTDKIVCGTNSSGYQVRVGAHCSINLTSITKHSHQKGICALKNKVILVMSDALRYDAAVAGMGYLGHLVEAKRASLYKIIGELPSMSRPMYETIHTGVTVSEHGVASNYIVRRSKMPSIFSAAHDGGLVTAAAAYYWVSELYNRAPFDMVKDREVDDDNLLIQHGRFYTRDEYPDADLYYLGGTLVEKFNPDYLLIHPMGMDYMGETYGADSSKYRNQAIVQDVVLANLVPGWLERGYTVMVTGDHGITADHSHGGTRPEMRDVPLFIIRPNVPGEGDTEQVRSHLQIAPTVCKLLGVAIPETMKAVPVV
jgi:predicted AlkP superfamily pyrophosphatase or phosphodiesterase